MAWSPYKTISKRFRDHPFKTSAICRGEGSIIGQICRQIAVKKLPMEVSRGSKIVKICRRLKWMVPNIDVKEQYVYT